MTPEEEVIYLQSHKAYIDSRIQTLRQKIKNDIRPKANLHKLSYTGLWVHGTFLLPFIKEWEINGHVISHLEDDAGLSRGTIRRIMDGRTTWTREETAEKILLALDLPHILRDLPVVRIKRQYKQVTEPPESKFYEE